MVGPSSSSQSEAYVWSGPPAGQWSQTSNWKTVTTNPLNPAVPVTSAAVRTPGANDDVTIPAAPDQGAYAIVGDEQALTFKNAIAARARRCSTERSR